MNKDRQERCLKFDFVFPAVLIFFCIPSYLLINFKKIKNHFSIYLYMCALFK